MEPAYIFMLATFAAAIVIGAAVPRRGIAFGLSAGLLVISVVVMMARSGTRYDGETLLYMSPFLLVILVIYGFLCKAGVALGHRLRFGGRRNEQ